MATNALETQGVTFTWNANTVGEITDFTGPGGAANVIDATHLGSTAREKIMGIADEGQFSFELNYVPTDAGQSALEADRLTRTRRACVLTLTDSPATTKSFNAYCLEFSISGGVDDKISASVTLEIDGAVTTA